MGQRVSNQGNSPNDAYDCTIRAICERNGAAKCQYPNCGHGAACVFAGFVISTFLFSLDPDTFRRASIEDVAKEIEQISERG